MIILPFVFILFLASFNPFLAFPTNAIQETVLDPGPSDSPSIREPLVHHFHHQFLSLSQKASNHTNANLTNRSAEPRIPFIHHHRRRQIRPNELSPTHTVNQEQYHKFLADFELISSLRNNGLKRPQLPFPPGRPKTRPTLTMLEERKYNFQTGDQFEDDFDCDMALLGNCESLLLEKIARIEGDSYLTGSGSALAGDGPATVNQGQATQSEILEICRSMDSEFDCLYDYASKCEKKMSWPTFTVLRFIITKNKEVMINCNKKHHDWMGLDMTETDDALMEPTEIRPPCINSTQVSHCMATTMELGFDPARDLIRGPDLCARALHFKKCLDELPSNNCSKLEQGQAVAIVVGSMLRFHPEEVANSSSKCGQVQALVKQTTVSEKPEDTKNQNRNHSLTEQLYFTYDQLIEDDAANEEDSCRYKMASFVGGCFGRFNGSLWAVDEAMNKVCGSVDPAREIPFKCCAYHQVAQCLSLRTLIHCGLHKKIHFQRQIINFLRGTLDSSCSLYFDQPRLCPSILAEFPLPIPV